MASFQEIVPTAEDYIRWDPNEETRAQVKALLDANEVSKLHDILGSRLAFGTAGLRGPMGPGYNHMNDIVILQTCQGLIRYLEEVLGPEVARERGLVVGYDHRSLGSLSSLGFARMTAAVFLSQGFKVYLLEGFVATPLVAYGVGYLKTAAGIMVTASHNPKIDNGYKVYWGNGSQIIPPHDSGIARCIAANLAPWQRYDTDATTVMSHGLAENVTDRLANSYFREIEKLCHHKDLNTQSALRIAYTAMHGVGHQWINRSFHVFGLSPAIPVPSQMIPDPTFPTVSFPNPEEKGALNEALAFAKQEHCDLIIANDPDADRLAAAECISGSQWHVFTGNEIGTLLGYWQILKWKEQHPGSEVVPAVLASVVSSRMLKHIANVEGIRYFDTLTGFKWLGNRSLELQAAGTPVLFSYEEALGYCNGDVVCDKDGVSGGAIFAEMAVRLREEGKTVLQQLQSLYDRYGEFVSYNSYIICRDPKKTDTIFARIRNGGPAGSYFTEVAGVNIEAIQDITLGYDSSTENHACDLPTTPDSHMLMFTFANGVTATFRTSGTEPKIKFYTEIAGQLGQHRDELNQILHRFVDQVVEEFLQPHLNGLA